MQRAKTKRKDKEASNADAVFSADDDSKPGRDGETLLCRYRDAAEALNSRSTVGVE